MNPWDKIVHDITLGNGDSHYENLIKTIMSADDREYARLCGMYPDHMNAIDRYKQANKFISDVRFERTKRGGK